MFRYAFIGAAALAAVSLAAPVHSEDVGGKPMIFVSGGGHNSLRQLTDNDDDDFDIGSDFETGYNLGGGIGVQLSDWAALRGVYTFARSQGEGGTFSPIAGNHFNRHYYGADIQFRPGSDGSFTPFLFIGGGAVTIDPADEAVLLAPNGRLFNNSSFTRPAGRFGVGFDYQFPDSGFGIYAEGAGWVYNWDRYGFDRTQVDTNWGGGLTYRFGY